ncbi:MULTISPECIES: hypothetical protein [Amycolatopsis]|nr:hypothetical protein [Amycolatopsis bullii]
MVVIAIVVCVGVLALAALGCWLVVRLDHNAKLRSLQINARAEKRVDLKFRLERDTSTPTTSHRGPSELTISDGRRPLDPAPAALTRAAEE